MAIMDRIRCPDQCAPRALRAELNSILMVVGAVLALASSARAATFVVNSTVDAIDAVPGNGVCETAPGNGVCTLRAAIQETNVLAGADTVTVPAGIYALTLNTGLTRTGATSTSRATSISSVRGPAIPSSTASDWTA